MSKLKKDDSLTHHRDAQRFLSGSQAVAESGLTQSGCQRMEVQYRQGEVGQVWLIE